MSWTDPCGNCGQHRADCDCKQYTPVRKESCEYCKHNCKKKSSDNKQYGCCEKFELAKK